MVTVQTDQAASELAARVEEIRERATMYADAAPDTWVYAHSIASELHYFADALDPLVALVLGALEQGEEGR